MAEPVQSARLPRGSDDWEAELLAVATGSQLYHPKGNVARPVYLILSNRSGLIRRYGQEGFAQVHQALTTLKRAIEGHLRLETLLLYADDPDPLAPYGLRPVVAADPGLVKGLVDDLDAQMEGEGRRIRYLLIVGGDGIVPFHRLPNPIDDPDTQVLSDNPYGARQADVLLPDRAVGRLPDSERDGVGFLCALIDTAVEGHRRPTSGKGALSALFACFRTSRPSTPDDDGLGYSASIWRKASRAVFQAIGQKGPLRISPPVTYEQFGRTELPHLSYFNLHGVEDGPNWYGQRDSLFPADYPLFPVALRPEDIVAVDQANTIVFSEACYGANVLGKDSATSIALRLLASRALAVVGSTRIAYGAITPPLVGADLVARHFWEALQQQMPVGDALVYARARMAQEMQERQGYLDGEDQKTLLSFVLYGDPSLGGAAPSGNGAGLGVGKAVSAPVICQRGAGRECHPAPEGLVAAVRERIEDSLPHMAQAQVHTLPARLCNGDCGHRCALAHPAAKGNGSRNGKWIVTLEKEIPVQGDGAHRQSVKVTVDERGRILKMAVSK